MGVIMLVPRPNVVPLAILLHYKLKLKLVLQRKVKYNSDPGEKAARTLDATEALGHSASMPQPLLDLRRQLRSDTWDASVLGHAASEGAGAVGALLQQPSSRTNASNDGSTQEDNVPVSPGFGRPGKCRVVLHCI